MAFENRGPQIVGITALTMILSIIVVLARVITRTLIRPQFGRDDALIVVTLFIFFGFNISEFVAVHFGFGRLSTELSQESVQATMRATLSGEVCAVWTYPTGKAAVACLLTRLFPGKTLKRVLWLFVIANAIFFYLNGVFFLAQCSPLAYQWDKSIQGGSCWAPTILVVWGYITGSVGAATDLAFAIIPWFYIAKLQMSFRKKLAIGAALSTGLFPFICSILKIKYTATLGALSDPTYDTVNLVLTGQAELCAINIAACIPTLRPLYLWFRGEDTQPYAKSRSSRLGDHEVYDATPENQTLPAILLRSSDDKSNALPHLQS